MNAAEREALLSAKDYLNGTLELQPVLIHLISAFLLSGDQLEYIQVSLRVSLSIHSDLVGEDVLRYSRHRPFEMSERDGFWRK